VKTVESIQESQDGDPIGKTHHRSPELLDWELDPCIGHSLVRGFNED